jgi:hypothetical protein
MAAASDGDQQTVRAGEVHGALHIGRVDALGDEAGVRSIMPFQTRRAPS